MKTTLLAIFCGVLVASAQVEETVTTMSKQFRLPQTKELIPTRSLPVVSNITHRITYTWEHSNGGVANLNAPKEAAVSVVEEVRVSSIGVENYSYISAKYTLPNVSIPESKMAEAVPYILLGLRAQKEVVATPEVGQVRTFVPFIPADNPSSNVLPEDK